MIEQKLSTGMGRGRQYRRTQALRMIEERTSNRIKFVEYRRDGSGPGQYVLQLNAAESLVLEGPATDAFIAGFETGVRALGELVELHKTLTLNEGTPPGRLYYSTGDHPVAAVEELRTLRAPAGLVIARATATGAIVEWQPVPGADRYSVRLKRRWHKVESWKPVASFSSESEAVELTLSEEAQYLLQVRAHAAHDQGREDSVWSAGLEFESTPPPA